MSTNLRVASKEWASRPDDERYTSLPDLKTAVMERQSECWSATPGTADLRVIPGENKELGIEFNDPAYGPRRLVPTNWSFGQLAQYAQAPASYLRRLPAELAAINLQWGLVRHADDAMILGRDSHLRAVTSTSYGRIWDSQVVQAVERANSEGRWEIPAASYASSDPKRATTLYASDRDVFIFLVDPKNPVEVGGEQLFRGFYTWNSEVGAATFGLCTFLYRYVCDNRIIWGASEVRELRIKHTGGAPERFAWEGERYLKRYSEESSYKLAAGIKAAQSALITLNKGTGDTVESWLQGRGFTKAQAKGSVEAATMEEGQARSFWDVVNGITAFARTIPHADERVELETKAGRLMDMVA